MFNMSKDKNNENKYYVNPIKQAWFNDLNFRRAIEAAIDRKSIILNIANGIGVPLFTAESPTSIFLNKNLKEPEYNINKAKELLKSSGFYTDSKGLLHDKNGNKVEFSLYTNSGNFPREAMGVAIKQDLSKLGIITEMEKVAVQNAQNATNIPMKN